MRSRASGALHVSTLLFAASVNALLLYRSWGSFLVHEVWGRYGSVGSATGWLARRV